MRKFRKRLTYRRQSSGMFILLKPDGLLGDAQSDRAVALTTEDRIHRAGPDPSALSDHSLRAGFATSAARAGVEERDIMRQTGHRSVAVMRRYVRDGQLFRANAAAAVGL